MASDNHDHPSRNISEREAEAIENRARLRAPVIYEIVRKDGEEEMARRLALVVGGDGRPVDQLLPRPRRFFTSRFPRSPGGRWLQVSVIPSDF